MIPAAQDELTLGGNPGKANRRSHGLGPSLEKAHLLYPGNAMAELGRYFFLQDGGKRPDYTGLDCIAGCPSDLGVRVAEGDGPEPHQIVDELATLIVPNPTAGRPHHAGGKTGVVRAEENLGTLASGGGEASNVFGQIT
jgi:hypothetical protein